jgi:L-iditol 2-dehydrogenase
LNQTEAASIQNEDTMQAIYYEAPRELALHRVKTPRPAAGEIVVKVKRALTCGTDLKTYLRGHPKFQPPTPFGHEFAGDIVVLGDGVEHFQKGMRITANVFAPCGTCYYCTHEQGNLCEAMIYNLGAFAEYLRIPAPIVRHNTFVLPDGFDYAHAAVLEPLVSVVHGQRRVAIQPGEHVAIFGSGGAIGLMHLQMAKASGAAQVIAVDRNEARLKIAAKLGASHAINPDIIDAVDFIRERTSGRGADVTIECAGALTAWHDAVAAVRKGGRVLWFGGLPADTIIEIDTARIHYDELTLLGTHGGTPIDAYRAFELLTHSVVRVEELISDVMPLEQTAQALERMARGEVIKIALNPEMK